MTCRQFPKDALHHLMEMGQIVLVDNKLVFVDEENTRQWIQNDIASAAEANGYTVRSEVLAAEVMRGLHEQMSR